MRTGEAEGGETDELEAHVMSYFEGHTSRQFYRAALLDLGLALQKLEQTLPLFEPELVQTGQQNTQSKLSKQFAAESSLTTCNNKLGVVLKEGEPVNSFLAVELPVLDLVRDAL